MYRKYKDQCGKAGDMGSGASKKKDSNQSKGATGNTQSDPVNKVQVQDGCGLPTSDNKVAVPQKKDRTPEEEARHQALIKEKQKELDNLMKTLNDTETMIRQAMAKNQASSLTMQAVEGDMDIQCPSPAKIVRIFTSSPFTDTKQERNILMKVAYPKIRKHCRRIGYEFQVVDMRWGVRDEATDDHMGTEICLKELKLCQQISTGPYFVSLLSHKYGYTAFPRLIDAGEFEKIFNHIREQDVKDLFQKWYTRDDNIVPPAYSLASISTHIPDFICNDPDRKKDAKNQWWMECEKMQDALEQTAKAVFNEKTARKYVMSVTETEHQEGILKVTNTNINNNKCLWLKRNIQDIDKQERNYALSRFKECLGPEQKVQKAGTMLKECVDEMKKKLDPRNILDYEVHWSQSGGIDPENKEHQAYLESLCEDFVNNMIEKIDKSVAERKLIENPLLDELFQHIRFAQTKCEGFAGREDTFAKLKEYIVSTDPGKPLVLHGSSGTGKTSIMAMTANRVREWMTKRPVVVLRFIGTSPDSSNLMSLLYSISSQIRKAYSLTPSKRYQTIEAQLIDFKASLLKTKPTKPLIILLDSLDQLDPAYDARKLAWINIKLPPHIKVILSTLPEPQYECFPSLKKMITEEDRYIDVPVLLNDDVNKILNNWLVLRGRQLTDYQRTVVLEAFKKCSTPLFLKLSFEESTSWSSYLSPDRSVLQDTVRASIDHLFKKLEKLHGKILFSRSMAYLTLANNGATEAELEDILSCDDDVLNDVYMYWTPPMRRLPPLLLVRIRSDLDQYLVERGADGVRVLYWYHRQFTEAALARYCGNAEENRLRHAHLADFFNGTWAGGRKKPYTTSKGEQLEADRQVSDQPLKFGEKEYNIRCLNNLTYHRIHAEQGDLLQEQCLANVNFLLRKLEVLPLYTLLDDFKLSRAIFKHHPLIGCIHDALLLSQKGLTTDPGQLIPQMLGRLDENEVTKDFLTQLRSYGNVYLEPSQSILDKPGGQLVHCIAAHKSSVDMIDMTTDGRYVLSVCQVDKEIKIWNVGTAQLERSVTNTGGSELARFCMADKWIAFVKEDSKPKKLIVEDVETGVNVFSLPIVLKDLTFCVAGKDNSLVLLFSSIFCVVYNLKDPKQDKIVIQHPEKRKFGSMSIPHGLEHYVVVCTDDQYFITVLDLQTMSFKKSFRGFDVVLDDDGDEEEYEVESVAIDPGETFLIYTTLFTSEIVFADFEGNRLRSIPGNADMNYRTLNFSPDGLYFYLCDRETLRFFDTNTLQEIDTLEHNKDIISARTVDMRTVVTIIDDSNLRIWDRTRPKKQGDLKTQATSTELNSIGEIAQFSEVDGTQYVIVRSKVDGNKQGKLALYDAHTQKYIRMMNVKNLEKVYVLDVSCVFMQADRRKPYIFNMDTMTMVKLVGTMDRYSSVRVYIKPDKLALTTRGQKNVKVYDIITGKVLYILKAGQKQNIDNVVVNKSGTKASAQTDEGPVLIFDLVNKKHLYNIYDVTSYGEYFANQMWINDAGTRLVFDISQPLPGMTGKADDTDHLVMWDIENRKELFRMYDLEYQKMYALIKSDDCTSIESVLCLDDNRLIIPCYDNIMRIYSIHTGELLTRLLGHTTSVQLQLHDDSPYILSYGSMWEEDCIRLWDKSTGKQVASYSLDKTISKLTLIGGSEHIMTIDKHATLFWRICNSIYPVSSDIPDLFKPRTKCDEVFKPEPAKTNGKFVVSEPDDPDTDTEIVSSDEDDDDDDDE